MIGRRAVDRVFRMGAMLVTASVFGGLLSVVAWTAAKGLGTVTWCMLTQTPAWSYYLGGGGGIANAIVGSACLAAGATLIALAVGVPCALYLGTYARGSRLAELVRASLETLWGVPSIVVGAFGFALMVWLGLKPSLLVGMGTVALLELPVIVRSIDEVMRTVPSELEEASLALGATRAETATRVIARQCMPGAVTGTLLAFGRGIGDAAAVMLTAGFTDAVPRSLTDPVATLPLLVLYQLGSPVDQVRQRAYGACLVLTLIVAATSLASRLVWLRLARHVAR